MSQRVALLGQGKNCLYCLSNVEMLVKTSYVNSLSKKYLSYLRAVQAPEQVRKADYYFVSTFSLNSAQRHCSPLMQQMSMVSMPFVFTDCDAILDGFKEVACSHHQEGVSIVKDLSCLLDAYESLKTPIYY